MSLSNSTYICILMDLLFYKNPSLVEKAFELLVSRFSSLKLVMKSLQKLQLLEDPQSIQTLAKVT